MIARLVLPRNEKCYSSGSCWLAFFLLSLFCIDFVPSFPQTPRLNTFKWTVWLLILPTLFTKSTKRIENVIFFCYFVLFLWWTTSTTCSLLVCDFRHKIESSFSGIKFKRWKEKTKEWLQWMRKRNGRCLFGLLCVKLVALLLFAAVTMMTHSKGEERKGEKMKTWNDSILHFLAEQSTMNERKKKEKIKCHLYIVKRYSNVIHFRVS